MGGRSEPGHGFFSFISTIPTRAAAIVEIVAYCVYAGLVADFRVPSSPELTQAALLCGCGGPLDDGGAALCTKCERRARLNRERFAGLREARLREDEFRCVVCGCPEERRLVVHHRRPGRHAFAYLVTLCRACHLRVHLTPRPSFAFVDVSPELYRLWRELHRRQPEQLLLLGPATPSAALQAPLFSPADTSV